MRIIIYTAIQAFIYLIEMSVFWLVVKSFNVEAVTTSIVCKIIAAIAAFFIHRRFSFNLTTHDHYGRQAIKYFLLLGFNVPASVIAMNVALWLIPVPVVAKFIADLTGLFITYWISKTFVFTSFQKSIKAGDG